MHVSSAFINPSVLDIHEQFYDSAVPAAAAIYMAETLPDHILDRVTPGQVNHEYLYIYALYIHKKNIYIKKIPVMLESEKKSKTHADDGIQINFFFIIRVIEVT